MKMTKLTIGIIAVILLLLPALTIAQEPSTLSGLNAAVSGTAISNRSSVQLLIGEVIKTVLGFLGIIFVILIIYGGFVWMTAGGEAGKIDKAKAIIISAVIGVVIVLASYVITEFVLNEVTKASGGL